jgi:multiple sugar transport system permease protein
MATLRRRESRDGLLLISPTLAIVVLMVIIPALWTVMLAFQDIRLINLRQAGVFGRYTLENFAYIVSAPGFADTLVNTLVYTVGGTVGSLVVGLVAALAVRGSFRGRTFVRGSLLIPYVAPVVAVTYVWEIMLNPQYGIANVIGIRWLGWERGIPFLSQQTGNLSLLGLDLQVPTAMLTVIAFEAWRYFPFAFLFILARLQALPRDLDEAALVDGATPLQRFRHITLPQLHGVIALLVVLRFIFTFNKFDDVYLLTGGGAGTEVISVRVYELLTARADIGGAAAQAMILAAVLGVCLIVYLAAFGRRTGGDAT